MQIQNLSICCPSATGKCINHCKTCTARQHENPYQNKYDGNRTDCIEYWNDVIKRMRAAQDQGCTTVMLTGSNEPQQNRRWLEGLYLAMKSLDKPFNIIEMQTTGAFLDRDYLQFLKNFGVTTIALSTFNIFKDSINIFVEKNADKNLKLERLCEDIVDLGMNLRLCINVTDYVFYSNNYSGQPDETFVNELLNRCYDLGASQVTFRKMWSSEGTPEAEWILKNTSYEEWLLKTINNIVTNEGTFLRKLPYGASIFDYKGFSIVVDDDSMGKETKDDDTCKYYIIRENGKMYYSWDSTASLVF